MRVTVAGGKYTVVMEEDGRLHALRYGEEWRDGVGDNLVYYLACEVETLIEKLGLLKLATQEVCAAWNEARYGYDGMVTQDEERILKAVEEATKLVEDNS